LEFEPIKANFTKVEIDFLSSDWLNSNPISISISKSDAGIRERQLKNFMVLHNFEYNLFR